MNIATFGDLSINACGATGEIITTSIDVLIGNRGVARFGDGVLYPLSVVALCLSPRLASITGGSINVYVNGRPVAMIDSMDDDGGFIITGNPTVQVNNNA